MGRNKKKGPFLWAVTRKTKTKLSENEIPDLNSLKPFEFETKKNIRNINSSSSDDEEGAEHKVKQISNSEWCECSAKAAIGRCSSK